MGLNVVTDALGGVRWGLALMNLLPTFCAIFIQTFSWEVLLKQQQQSRQDMCSFTIYVQSQFRHLPG
jgi:hypothetical protein